jgi:hypothetical protein
MESAVARTTTSVGPATGIGRDSTATAPFRNTNACISFIASIFPSASK